MAGRAFMDMAGENPVVVAFDRCEGTEQEGGAARHCLAPHDGLSSEDDAFGDSRI
jgi:hypothetical protein